jgi:hypothetical protein
LKPAPLDLGDVVLLLTLGCVGQIEVRIIMVVQFLRRGPVRLPLGDEGLDDKINI